MGNEQDNQGEEGEVLVSHDGENFLYVGDLTRDNTECDISNSGLNRITSIKIKGKTNNGIYRGIPITRIKANPIDVMGVPFAHVVDMHHNDDIIQFNNTCGYDSRCNDYCEQIYLGYYQKES